MNTESLNKLLKTYTSHNVNGDRLDGSTYLHLEGEPTIVEANSEAFALSNPRKVVFTNIKNIYVDRVVIDLKRSEGVVKTVVEQMLKKLETTSNEMNLKIGEKTFKVPGEEETYYRVVEDQVVEIRLFATLI